MHPTKREVGFLHRDALIQAVCAAVEALLLASDSQCAQTSAAQSKIISWHQAYQAACKALTHTASCTATR